MQRKVNKLISANMLNLIELIKKNDQNVEIHVPNETGWSDKISLAELEKNETLKISKRKVNGRLCRGFLVMNSLRVVIRQFYKWIIYQDSSRPDSGWAIVPTTKECKAVITLSCGNDDLLKYSVVSQESDEFQYLCIPIIASHEDLIISIDIMEGSLFFLVHEILDRSTIYSLCKGKGIEIGPGPRPQILPETDIDITYIEQMPAAEWKRLYKKDLVIDDTLWERYIIGNASNLPVLNNSCDFIFSSHVFEHLANPLGHLEYWSSKLKVGGLVAAVIPDIYGCRDYIFPPSTLMEILQEYESGIFDLQEKHYRRVCNARSNLNFDKLVQDHASIHAHYYTQFSIVKIALCVLELGFFKNWKVISSQNHKDFHLLLWK
jgi:predicted SAM-dependent methyltransferase